MRDEADFSQLPDGPVLNDDFCPSSRLFSHRCYYTSRLCRFHFFADVRFEV